MAENKDEIERRPRAAEEGFRVRYRDTDLQKTHLPCDANFVTKSPTMKNISRERQFQPCAVGKANQNETDAITKMGPKQPDALKSKSNPVELLRSDKKRGRQICEVDNVSKRRVLLGTIFKIRCKLGRDIQGYSFSRNGCKPFQGSSTAKHT